MARGRLPPGHEAASGWAPACRSSVLELTQGQCPCHGSQGRAHSHTALVGEPVTPGDRCCIGEASPGPGFAHGVKGKPPPQGTPSVEGKEGGTWPQEMASTGLLSAGSLWGQPRALVRGHRVGAQGWEHKCALVISVNPPCPLRGTITNSHFPGAQVGAGRGSPRPHVHGAKQDPGLGLCLPSPSHAHTESRPLVCHHWVSGNGAMGTPVSGWPWGSMGQTPVSSDACVPRVAVAINVLLLRQRAMASCPFLGPKQNLRTAWSLPPHPLLPPALGSGHVGGAADQGPLCFCWPCAEAYTIVYTPACVHTNSQVHMRAFGDAVCPGRRAEGTLCGLCVFVSVF